MNKVPEMIFIIDTNMESLAVKEAIKLGVKYIKKHKGILIIAGKGHEDTQTYKEKNYIFNDKLISSNYAKNL